MTPAELARRHPRLYHLTEPDAWPSIRAHGLLSAEALTALFEVPEVRRAALLGTRRARAGLERLLGARTNRGRPRLVLELDTRALAERHATRLRLSPINSGSTIRKAARRGPATFAPMQAHSREDWRRLRGRRDRVLEVSAAGAIADIERYTLDLWRSDDVPFAL